MSSIAVLTRALPVFTPLEVKIPLRNSDVRIAGHVNKYRYDTPISQPLIGSATYVTYRYKLPHQKLPVPPDRTYPQTEPRDHRASLSIHHRNNLNSPTTTKLSNYTTNPRIISQSIRPSRQPTAKPTKPSKMDDSELDKVRILPSPSIHNPLPTRQQRSATWATHLPIRAARERQLDGYLP